MQQKTENTRAEGLNPFASFDQAAEKKEGGEYILGNNSISSKLQEGSKVYI